MHRHVMQHVLSTAPVQMQSNFGNTDFLIAYFLGHTRSMYIIATPTTLSYTYYNVYFFKKKTLNL